MKVAPQSTHVMAEQLHLHKCCATFKRFRVSQSSQHEETIATHACSCSSVPRSSLAMRRQRAGAALLALMRSRRAVAACRLLWQCVVANRCAGDG